MGTLIGRTVILNPKDDGTAWKSGQVVDVAFDHAEGEFRLLVQTGGKSGLLKLVDVGAEKVGLVPVESPPAGVDNSQN